VACSRVAPAVRQSAAALPNHDDDDAGADGHAHDDRPGLPANRDADANPTDGDAPFGDRDVGTGRQAQPFTQQERFRVLLGLPKATPVSIESVSDPAIGARGLSEESRLYDASANWPVERTRVRSKVLQHWQLSGRTAPVQWPHTGDVARVGTTALEPVEP
jgi:hypothetical protein